MTLAIQFQFGRRVGLGWADVQILRTIVTAKELEDAFRANS